MAVLRPYFNHLYTINLLKSIDYRGPTPQPDALNPNAKIQNPAQSSENNFIHDPNQIPFNWVHLKRSMPATDKRLEAGKRLYFEPFVNYLDNLLLFLYRISIFRRKRIPEAKYIGS